MGATRIFFLKLTLASLACAFTLFAIACGGTHAGSSSSSSTTTSGGSGTSPSSGSSSGGSSSGGTSSGGTSSTGTSSGGTSSGGSSSGSSSGGTSSGGSTSTGGSGGSSSGSPSGPAQYLYTANNQSGNISGFRIENDGTLTPISGSPFPAGSSNIGPRSIVSGDTTSLAVSTNQLQGWTVDPATGKITNSSSATVPGFGSPGELLSIPSRGLLYQVTYDICVSGHCNSLGTATEHHGSVTYTQPDFSANPPQANPTRIALDPNGKFLYATLEEYGLGYFLGVFALAPTGEIASQVSVSTQICQSQDIIANASGGNTYIYTTCYTGGIELHVVNNSTENVVSSTSFATSGVGEGMAIDPTGQYLLVADSTNNAVDVFKIDSSTGNLGNASTQTPAGTGPNVIAFDATGNFVYVADGGCVPGPGTACSIAASNQVQAFKWSNGTLTAMAAYPAGTSPVGLAIVKP